MRRYDQKQSDPFYYSKPWLRTRAAALARDQGTCQDCLAEYRAGTRALKDIKSADMVHHIIPYQTDPTLALVMDNLISLCDMHHNVRHPEKGRSQSSASKAPASYPFRVIKV